MLKKPHKIALGIILMLTSYSFIIYKIIHFEDLQYFSFTTLYSFPAVLLLALVFLLMVLNWSLESIKWKILIGDIQKINFFYALKAVFSGITIGIFTPNRVGEIGGRILFLNKGNRTFGVLATSLGSFAQIITTLTLGILGFIIFLIKFPEKAFINPILNSGSAVICSLILLFLVWTFFNIKKITPILNKVSFFRNRESQLNYFTETKFNVLIKSLFLSFIRYAVFSTQFYLLLLLFDVQITITQAYISISLIYLFATLIPTTTLIELGIRGSLAIFFIGMFSENILGITFSTFIVWFINLAIPSIIGSVFFIKNKFDISN